MNIISVSQSKQEAVVSLTAKELVLLRNVLYNNIDGLTDKEKKLYCDIILASSLSRYGNVDLFDLTSMVLTKEEEIEKALKERKNVLKIEKGEIHEV